MVYCNFILILSATLVYGELPKNNRHTFGSLIQGVSNAIYEPKLTKATPLEREVKQERELVSREIKLYTASTARLNMDGAYNITIDMVDIQFNGGGDAICKLISGGQNTNKMEIKLYSLDYGVDYWRHQNTGLWTTIIVFGRYNGEREYLGPADIEFS